MIARSAPCARSAFAHPQAIDWSFAIPTTSAFRPTRENTNRPFSADTGRLCCGAAEGPRIFCDAATIARASGRLAKATSRADHCPHPRPGPQSQRDQAHGARPPRRCACPLVCFRVTAEFQSVRECARRLNVASAAVSRQVGQLEDALGMALFQRGRGRLRLMAAGESLHRHANHGLRGRPALCGMPFPQG
ncbi:MAG: LysR family transcriptional regulator [Amaricoccus sp.]|uniref:helix-turn-helix domain-containing protein n=1 Tax=Amaricoccus sp. TaxID=1872485 RepID=UPI0039E2F58F